MLNQITTMRLPDGSEVAFVDWADKPLWSTVDLLSAFTDTEIDAFTYVVGDEVPATANATVRRLSTERDTNVSTPGSMASTEEMLVYAIKPEFLESRTADANPTELDVLTFQEQGQPIARSNRLAILHDAMILRLVVSQKIEHSAPLGYYNTGFGVLTSMGDTTATSLNNRGTAGMPSQEAVRSYGIPIHIGGQEKYRVQLVNASAAAVPSGQDGATPPVNDTQIVHSVRIHLDGLYKRPVS
jgi:hypothetical protein